VKTRSLVVLGTLSIAMALSACGSSTGTSSTSSAAESSSADAPSSDSASVAPASTIPDGPIIIGLPIGLTGFINAYDGNLLIGAQVQADAINAAGGVDGHQIKLVTADTASDIAQGGPAAQEVIAQGAQFIMPTVDYNFGGEAAKAAQAANLIAISAADDVRLGLSIGNNVFNLDTGGATAGAVLAQYATETLKWKTAYVLNDTTLDAMTANCGGFEDSFKAQGGTVVASDTYQATSDASAVTAVSKLVAAKDSFDGIMLCGYPPSGVTVLKQIRDAGVKQPITLTDAFDANFWQEAFKGTDSLNDVYIVSYAPVTPGQAGDSAAADALKMAQDQGKDVTVSLAYLTGFAGVQAIAEAVKETQSVDADKIREYFETFTDHPLAIGPTTWTPTCHARVGNPMYIANVVDGLEQFVTVLKPDFVPANACG